METRAWWTAYQLCGQLFLEFDGYEDDEELVANLMDGLGFLVCERDYDEDEVWQGFEDAAADFGFDAQRVPGFTVM